MALWDRLDSTGGRGINTLAEEIATRIINNHKYYTNFVCSMHM